MAPRGGTEISDKMARIPVFLDFDIVGYPHKYPRYKVAAAAFSRTLANDI